MKDDIFAIETTENCASDGSHEMVRSHNAMVISVRRRSVVLTETVAVTSNITCVFALNLTSTPVFQPPKKLFLPQIQTLQHRFSKTTHMKVPRNGDPLTSAG